MSWIRIRICISPYGSGSDFYYTNPDPQIRIRIRITVPWEEKKYFDTIRVLNIIRMYLKIIRIRKTKLN